jgi:hypothetical protein
MSLIDQMSAASIQHQISIEPQQAICISSETSSCIFEQGVPSVLSWNIGDIGNHSFFPEYSIGSRWPYIQSYLDMIIKREKPNIIHLQGIDLEWSSRGTDFLESFGFCVFSQQYRKGSQDLCYLSGYLPEIYDFELHQSHSLPEQGGAIIAHLILIHRLSGHCINTFNVDLESSIGLTTIIENQQPVIKKNIILCTGVFPNPDDPNARQKILPRSTFIPPPYQFVSPNLDRRSVLEFYNDVVDGIKQFAPPTLIGCPDRCYYFNLKDVETKFFLTPTQRIGKSMNAGQEMEDEIDCVIKNYLEDKEGTTIEDVNVFLRMHVISCAMPPVSKNKHSENNTREVNVPIPAFAAAHQPFVISGSF